MAMFVDTCSHRIILNSKAHLQTDSASTLLQDILHTVGMPHHKVPAVTQSGFGRDCMVCSWIQRIVIALLCVIHYMYPKTYVALITLIILSFPAFTSFVRL